MIAAAAALQANAIEKKFLEGYESVPSRHETDAGTNISMMGKKIVFFQNGEAYCAEIGDSLDLKNATKENGLGKMGIEGQFTYYQKSKTIYFSHDGQLYSATQEKDGWTKLKALDIEGFSATRVTERGTTPPMSNLSMPTMWT